MATNDPFFGRIKDNWRQRAHEKPSFASEFSVIPQWLVTAVGCLYALAVVLLFYAARTVPDAMPGPLVGEPLVVQFLAIFAIVTGCALLAGSYILLIGYVNRDAKRRGMSPTLWTIIAIFVPYLVGVIIYFVMREPLPFECPRCGRLVNGQFNFCPNCQCNLRPNCPNCRREIRPGDRFCPHCGTTLQAAPAAAPAEASAPNVG
jgi:RNA polymerase subunit RPABC4/transcription elongation factor Spt4